MKVFISILSISLFFVSSSYAKNSTKKFDPYQKIVPPSYIKKVLDRDFAKNICKKNGNLMKCYQISEKSCVKVSQKNLSKCFKEKKQNRKISSVAAIRLSESIGLCVSKKNRTAFRKKKKRGCKK